MRVIGLEKRKIQIFEYLDNKGTLGDFLKGFVFREVQKRAGASFNSNKSYKAFWL